MPARAPAPAPAPALASYTSAGSELGGTPGRAPCRHARQRRRGVGLSDGPGRAEQGRRGCGMVALRRAVVEREGSGTRPRFFFSSSPCHPALIDMQGRWQT